MSTAVLQPWTSALADEGFTPPAMAPPQPALPPGRWPDQGCWTWADYLRLPNDGRRYEIIRGVLYVSPAPIFDHQYAIGELFYLLKDALESRNGLVVSAPFDVVLPDLAGTVQPDLVVLLGDRVPVAGQTKFEGVPDLVVEVVSPGSQRLDRSVKLSLYEVVGVPEYWLVDPKARTVTVFVPRGDGEPYVEHGHWRDGEVATSKLFAGFDVKVESLFP